MFFLLFDQSTFAFSFKHRKKVRWLYWAVDTHQMWHVGVKFKKSDACKNFYILKLDMDMTSVVS